MHVLPISSDAVLFSDARWQAWKHDHSVENNSGWNRASSKLVLGGWETYIVVCGPQSYKGLGYIHWPAKQRIRCHGNTYTNTHCENFLTEHLPERLCPLNFRGSLFIQKTKCAVWSLKCPPNLCLKKPWFLERVKLMLPPFSKPQTPFLVYVFDCFWHKKWFQHSFEYPGQA